jgi:hypothetical protein
VHLTVVNIAITLKTPCKIAEGANRRRKLVLWPGCDSYAKPASRIEAFRPVAGFPPQSSVSSLVKDLARTSFGQTIDEWQ